MRRTSFAILAMSAASILAAGDAGAQQTPAPEQRVRVLMRRDAEARGDQGGRAMLGVSTTSDGKLDTLGLLIASVSANSPAEKAGLEEGNRLASINGVSLKVVREEAGEPDMNGAMSRRLVREMAKVKAGDEVSLEVHAGGRTKAVKVKTVAADDLMRDRRTREGTATGVAHSAIGIALSPNGSKRDTLGVFVAGVTDAGPAEKAGIVEGDRIASVNGVDLRTPREDAGDAWVSSSRVMRLQREISKVKPGESVELVVWSAGRSRTVKVTTVKAEELRRGNSFGQGFGEGDEFRGMMPMPPMAPIAPMPPASPHVEIFRDGSRTTTLRGITI